MTATIDPRGMEGACFDPKERLDMYISTLQFYVAEILDNANQHIIFVENSGWDLNTIRKSLSHNNIDNIEFISLSPDLFNITKGKGYNELLMINLAIERSTIIKKSGLFFKVTGRYPIYNISYFLANAISKIAHEGNVMYADIKDHRLYDILKTGWCGHAFEARLWGIKVDFYLQEIAPKYSECDDYNGRLVEHVVFDVLKKNSVDKLSLRFKREPHFGGIEGSNMQSISFSKNQNSILGNMKRYVGNTLRFLFPWFKF